MTPLSDSTPGSASNNTYDVAHGREEVRTERLWRHPADWHRRFTVTQTIVVLDDQLPRQTEVGYLH